MAEQGPTVLLPGALVGLVLTITGPNRPRGQAASEADGLPEAGSASKRCPLKKIAHAEMALSNELAVARASPRTRDS